MNIFILNTNLKECARAHCDKHVVKMILEHAQMISTTLRYFELDAPYRMTHKNHPCSIWVRESRENFYWLKQLTFHLNNEFKYRFSGKSHKSWEAIKHIESPAQLESKGLTTFAQAMPEAYRSSDPVEAYRKYYIKDKAYMAKWTGREIPLWFLEGCSREKIHQ